MEHIPDMTEKGTVTPSNYSKAAATSPAGTSAPSTSAPLEHTAEQLASSPTSSGQQETAAEAAVALTSGAPALDIDDHFSEVDEGYVSSISSSSLTSISSSIRTGVLENGRTYPNFGKHEYGLPVDDAELDRNDLQHAKFTRLLNGLHQSPIGDDVQNILDLGTGTGIWAVDMADAYPSASVVGVDIAPTQPSWVPPNCQFEIDDMEGEWVRTPSSYDLIHCREMLLAVRNWSRLLEQCHTHLKPGGWLELGCTVPQPSSDDGSMSLGPSYFEIAQLLLQMSEVMGTSILAPFQWKQQMQDLGFVNVREIVRKIPLGPWPKNKTLKEIGSLELAQVPEALEPCVLRGFTGVLGGDVNELQVLLATARKELHDPKMHSYVYL